MFLGYIIFNDQNLNNNPVSTNNRMKNQFVACSDNDITHYNNNEQVTATHNNMDNSLKCIMEQKKPDSYKQNTHAIWLHLYKFQIILTRLKYYGLGIHSSGFKL